MLKYFSMFSGIGGFELGINSAIGGECIGFSEIDKNAISIYKHHFPEHRNFGDASKIDPAELPDFDLLVGGFPCQAFSIAGKRLGFEDTRGTLFFDIARILAHKRPRHFLLENVKGLLSHDEGKTFATILGVLSDLGYRVEWEVVNSKDHGVPQNRERVFFVGHLGNGCPGQVFPLGTGNGETSLIQGQPNVCCLRARHEADGSGSYIAERKQHEESKCIELTTGKGQAERVYSVDGIATCQNALGGGGGAKTGLYLDGFRIRRLTPRECERLQGFPDDWTKYGDGGKVMSDSARYKACGNAVTVNVIEAIVRRLKSLRDKQTIKDLGL